MKKRSHLGSFTTRQLNYRWDFLFLDFGPMSSSWKGPGNRCAAGLHGKTPWGSGAKGEGPNGTGQTLKPRRLWLSTGE